MVLGKGDLLWPDKVSSHFPWLAKLVSQALADKSAEKNKNPLGSVLCLKGWDNLLSKKDTILTIHE